MHVASFCVLCSFAGLAGLTHATMSGHLHRTDDNVDIVVVALTTVVISQIKTCVSMENIASGSPEADTRCKSMFAAVAT